MGVPLTNTNTTPRSEPRGTVAPGIPCLVVIQGRARGRRFVLTNAQTVIGRDAVAIALDDSGVSRRHAKLIVAADGSVLIMDLGSTNRTRVNNAIIELATLMPGDTIAIGPDVRLRLEYAEAPDTTVAPVASIELPGELSHRQWEVAQMIARGLGNAEIATALHISPNTVARHLENIYARLEVHSRANLTRWVLERMR